MTTTASAPVPLSACSTLPFTCAAPSFMSLWQDFALSERVTESLHVFLLLSPFFVTFHVLSTPQIMSWVLFSFAVGP